MNIVYTKIGSFITEDTEAKIKSNLTSGNGVEYLQKYMNKSLKKRDALKVLADNFFIEDYSFE